MTSSLLLFDVDAEVLERIGAGLAASHLLVVQERTSKGMRALARAGVRPRAWDEFVPERLGPLLGRELERVDETLGAALAEPSQTAPFDTERGNILPLIAPELRRRIVEQAGAQIAALETLDHMADQLELAAIVFGGRPTPAKHALVERARRRRIPCLQLVDGLDPGSEDLLEADRFAVWGPRSAQALARLGISEDRIVRTGAADWDAFFEDEVRMERDEACRRLGLDPARKVVTLVLAPEAGRLAQRIELLRSLSGALQRTGAEPQLVIRAERTQPELEAIAPQTLGAALDDLCRWLAGQGHRSLRVVLDRRPEAIRAADLVLVEREGVAVVECELLERRAALATQDSLLEHCADLSDHGSRVGASDRLATHQGRAAAKLVETILEIGASA